MPQLPPTENPMLSGFGRPPIAWVKVGGSLGVAGTLLGLLVFLTAIIGFSAALMFGPLVALFGVAGLVISIAGTVSKSPDAADGIQPLAAMFVTFVSIIAGIMECAFMQ